MSKILCDTKDRIKILLKKAEDSPCLKEIIAMLPDEIDDELRNMAKEKGIEIVTFDEVQVSRTDVLSDSKYVTRYNKTRNKCYFS